MGRKYRARDTFSTYANGCRVFLTVGSFAQVAKVENCFCEDGMRRTVRVTSNDCEVTGWLPAVTSVNGKSVSGVLVYSRNGYEFVAGGSNRHLIVKEADDQIMAR